MGYEVKIPANQLGRLKILWGMREYGFPGVWVRRVLTVPTYITLQTTICELAKYLVW